jgi:hypothetical protein
MVRRSSIPAQTQQVPQVDLRLQARVWSATHKETQPVEQMEEMTVRYLQTLMVEKATQPPKAQAQARRPQTSMAKEAVQLHRDRVQLPRPQIYPVRPTLYRAIQTKTALDCR